MNLHKAAHSSLSLALYGRLSGFYFFYFAALGALLPYWSLYLQGQGYDSREIGWLAATIMGTRIVAPNLWGWLGDHSGQRVKIIRWGAGLAALFFSAVLLSEQVNAWRFECLLLSVFFYSFFWNAILSQFEVVTLNHLGDKPQQYSAVRLWGSIGFIVAVTLIGIAFDSISTRYLPWILLSILLLLWVNSLLVTDVSQRCRIAEPRQGFFTVLMQKTVLCFLLSALLLQLSFGPYYTFFSVYLDRLGYSNTAVGLLWSLGVIAEIIVFVFMHKILPAVGVRWLLLFSCAVATLRWLLLAYFSQFAWVLVFSQCLHAFAFGSAHAASIEFVRRYFSSRNTLSGDHQGQGQSLYSSIGWGCGGALGAVLSGYLWQEGSDVAFVFAASMSALACVFLWLGLKRNDPLLVSECK